MRKILSALLKALGIVSLAYFIWAGYLLYSFSQPVKVVEIGNGTAGAYVIGETKESILAKFPEESYSAGPGANQCGTTWIKAKTMNAQQKQCLLGAPQWDIGSGIKSLCPERTNFFATLYFNGSTLVKVGIRCMNPE